MSNNLQLILQFSEYLAPIVFAIFFALLINILFLFGRKGLRLILRIAVVGRSASGKTSLITVVFDHIISGKAARYVSVTGSETVDRIRDQLLRLNTDLQIGATKDNDVFAYRFNVDKPMIGFVKRRIAVEIADFPGEYSEELGSNYSDEKRLDVGDGLGLYRKEFFSWVIGADKYIFVVDGEQAFVEFKKGRDALGLYIFITTVELKNAVLRLKQELLDEDVSKREVMLVFTKADLYDRYFVGSGSKVALNSKENSIEDDFNIEKLYADLINFLENNFRKVNVMRHSSLAGSKAAVQANERLVQFATPRVF